MPPVGLFYELDFRLNGVYFSAGGDIFTVYLGDAANESIKNAIPRISFSQESNGKAYITLYGSVKEIGSGKEFIGKWHNIQVLMDNANDRISVYLDEKLVLENVHPDSLAYFSKAISFSVGADNATEVDIDDVSVSAFYSQEDKNQWITLFKEDFECLNDEKGLEKYVSRTKGEQNKKILATDLHRLTQTGKGFLSLSCETSCESQWQKNLGFKGEQVTVVKPFNIPIDFPFDTSDKPFEIKYNDDMNSDSAAAVQLNVYAGYGGHGSPVNSYNAASKTKILTNRSPGRTQSGTLVDTYYIYSFDNKLMAEYDQNGVCTKEYIYLGNRMMAEYKPQSNEYFYYMTDQINSTRVITNGSGDVVYSEAYSPYGEVQRTWTDNYKPKMKFSGKEREYYSDLDYFGALYYNHQSFRFNSVDPIINREAALYNPQLWNLYAYCGNNPITYKGPDGRDFLDDLLKKAGSTLNNVVPNTMFMKGWEEHRKTVDKQVEKAIKIAVFIGGVIVIIEMVPGGNDSGKSNNKDKISSTPSKMQIEVEKGQAPTEIKRVDDAHVPGQEPHVHLKDGTSLTKTGKAHDKHKGTPKPTNKTKKWLKKHGWE